jgi:hypothetical protein
MVLRQTARRTWPTTIFFITSLLSDARNTHFKLILVPAAILRIRCVYADCNGPDEDYFNEGEVELDPTVLSSGKLGAREIEFSSSDPSTLIEQADNICDLSAYDRYFLECLLTDEAEAAEETDGSEAMVPAKQE